MRQSGIGALDRGDNDGNKIDIWGQFFLQNQFLALADEDKPKFLPSETSGRMQWPKNDLPDHVT